MTNKKAHYSEAALKNTRFFVKTNEHTFPLPWWTTRFHQCKSLIEARDKFPHHVVDARELTKRIAAEMADKERDWAIVDSPNLGMFRASDSAAIASLSGKHWALFCKICAHIGGIRGWENAWFVRDDGEPNWPTATHEDLQPDLMQERQRQEAMS